MFITDKAIDLGEFAVAPLPRGCGGTALFAGHVRDHHEGRKVDRLLYECYASMAENQIQRIVAAVSAETGVKEIRVIHRVGWLEVGDVAVAISASGAHRQEAFAACRQVIDRIKEDVPIWKKEVYEDATQDWVICTHNNEGS